MMHNVKCRIQAHIELLIVVFGASKFLVCPHQQASYGKESCRKPYNYAPSGALHAGQIKASGQADESAIKNTQKGLP